jgi:hypothetical protein
VLLLLFSSGIQRGTDIRQYGNRMASRLSDLVMGHYILPIQQGSDSLPERHPRGVET